MYLAALNPNLQAARARVNQSMSFAQRREEASAQARALLATGLPWARVQQLMQRAGTWSALNTI